MKTGLIRLLSILIVLSVCGFASPGFCKEGKKDGYNPKESFEEFSRKLNLTKEQKEDIRPILNDQVGKIQEVYREAREKEMRILEENQQKVMEALNPQQQEKYRKMIEDRKKRMAKRTEADVPVVVAVIVAEPVIYYGKSVVVEGFIKRPLTDDAFILSDKPDGDSEIVVVGAGPAVIKKPVKGEKVAVRGVLQNFKIDNIEKQLKVNLDEGIFGQLENKPGIFARWVKVLKKPK